MGMQLLFELYFLTLKNYYEKKDNCDGHAKYGAIIGRRG